MKKLFMVMAITCLPISGFAFGGPDDALEALKEYQEAASESSSIRDDVEANKQKLEGYQENVEELNGLLENYQEQVTDLQAKKDRLSGSFAGFEGRRDAAQAEMTRLQQELQTFNDNDQAQRDKEKEIERIQGVNSDLTSQKRKHQTDARKASQEATRLLGTLRTAKAEDRAGILAQVEAKEAEAQRLSGLADSAQSQIAANNTQIATLEQEADSIDPYTGLNSFKRASLERQIAQQEAIKKNNERELAEAQAELTQATSDYDAAVAQVTSTQGQIDTKVGEIQAGQTSEQRLNGEIAKMSAKAAIKSMLTDGDAAKFKAEMMFRDLEDIYGIMESAGADRAFVMEEMKSQIVENLDKTPIGLYVKEKLAQANGGGSSDGNALASCERVQMCQIQQNLFGGLDFNEYSFEIDNQIGVDRGLSGAGSNRED